MNLKSQRIKNQKNYFNVFPENRHFYFLDFSEKLNDFQTTDFEDPEYIYVISESKNKQIKENLYIRKDFLLDYYFIKANENISKIDLNFIISKFIINVGGRGVRLLTEIKKRPLLIDEIYKRTKINFNSKDFIYLKELFTVPTELKFYNIIYFLYYIFIV